METLQALIKRLEKVSEEVNVDAVFGKPQTIEGRVLIPVAELSYGFGMGIGSGPSCDCACHSKGEGDADCCDGEEACDCACHSEDASDVEAECCCGEEACDCCDGQAGSVLGGGGGAGAKVRPIAYIEVGPEGVHVQSITDEQKIALAGILLSAWAVGWVGLVLKTLFTRRR